MVDEVEETVPESPGVLLDRIVFGLTAEMSTPLSLADIVKRLQAVGIGRLAAPMRADRATLDLNYSVPDLPYGSVAKVSGRLRLEAGQGDLRVLGGSHLEVNAMRLLRTALEAPPDAAAGLAGDNFVGPLDDEWQTYLTAQIVDVASAMVAIVEGLADVAEAPMPVLGRLRLRWAEVCRDLGMDDAPTFARRLASRWLGGHLRSQRHYCGGLEIGGVLATVSWGRGSRHAPVQKVYAKTGTLLRTEVTARRAEAVGHLLTGRRRAADADAPLDADAVGDLLSRFAAASTPLLDEALAVVEEVEDSDHTMIELMLGLAPLLALAAPSPRRTVGRPVSDAVREAAREAVESLLHIGRITTGGLPGGTALRKALDGMADGEGGILRRYGANRASFALRPQWAAARNQLIATSLSTDGRLDPP